MRAWIVNALKEDPDGLWVRLMPTDIRKDPPKLSDCLIIDPEEDVDITVTPLSEVARRN